MFVDLLGAIDGTCSVSTRPTLTSTSNTASLTSYVNPYCTACDSHHTAIMSIKGEWETWVCKDCKFNFPVPTSYVPVISPCGTRTRTKTTTDTPERELVEIGEQNDPLGGRKPPILGKKKSA